MKNRKLISVLICALLLFTAVFAVSSYGATSATSDGLKIPKQDDSVYDLVSPVTIDYPAENYKATKKLESVPHTVEAWVFYPSTLNGATAGPIIGNYASDTSYGCAFINFEIYKNGAPRIWWGDEFGYNHYSIVFDGARVPTNSWTHVSFVYNDNSGIVSCYVNGILAEEKFYYPALDGGVVDYPFVLGGDQRSLNSGYFKGELKDVAIFSDVRTADEISKDYTALSYTEEGLLCYYDVDASDKGKNIKDETGNGYDLTYSKTWLSEEEMEEIRKGYGDFESDYSFAVFGDTQRITEDYPNLLGPMYQWVVDNKEEKNIVYSLGLGDITDDNGGSVRFSKDADGNWVIDANGTYNEWDVAKAAVTILNGHVPYSLVRGNHDIMNSKDRFNEWFGTVEYFTSQFEGENGGKYTDTGVKDPVTNSAVSYANTWCTYTFTADGKDVNYLFLNLDYGASDDVLAWASSVISQEKYKDYKVVISTHCYLYSDGTTEDMGDATPPSIMRDFMNNGDEIWEKFVSKHPNIEMFLSGHITSNSILVTRTNAYIDGAMNTVTEMLINPQAIDYRVRSGLVAMFYFDESENKVAFEYYSPTRNAYFMTANQFVLDLDDAGEDRIPDAWDGTTRTAPEGKGTKADPYIISSPSNLLWMAKQVIDSTSNTVFEGKYFKQVCDLDLDGKAVQSIGFYFDNFKNMRAFAGNYDGGGYSIKNGTIASATDPDHTPSFTTSFGSGLFGVIYGAVIENVVLEDVQVVGRAVSGGIVGIAASPVVEVNDELVSFNIISGCVVKDTVKLVALDTASENAKNTGFDNPFKAGRIGSICGMAYGTLIEGCTSAADIALGGDFVFAGGIVGTAGLNTVVDNCAYTGDITLKDNTATSASAFGGIVGAVSPSENTTDSVGNAIKAHGDLTVTNCYSTATYTYIGSGAASNVTFGNIIGYSTVGNGGVYTETGCFTAQNDAIDTAIAGIRAGGSERVWSIGVGEPTAAANNGAKYLDTKSGTYYTYIDGAWTQLSNLGMAESTLETPYGNIPEEHRGSPMVVFEYVSGAWKFYDGYSDYYTMTDYVRRPAGSSLTGKAVVYFRSDVCADSYTTNLGWVVGTVIFDLGGHTLYQTENHVFPAIAKYGNSYEKNPDLYGAPGYFEIKNGNIVLDNKGLFEISAYGAKYNDYATETNYKSFYYTFSDVNISLADGATVTDIMGAFGDSNTVSKSFSQKTNLNVKFEDSCSIDITNATKSITLFNANDTKYAGVVSGKTYYYTNSIVNIEVGAISVISDTKNFTWYSVNENNGSSVVFLENAGGRRATLTVPSSITPVTDVDLPGTKTFAHDLYQFSSDSKAKTVTYTLTETPYGGIGSTYVDLDAYPCVLFVDNKDGTYKFSKGYADFYNAVAAARDTSTPVSSRLDTRRIVFIRKDITSKIPSTNLNWSINTIVIDLGGHTVTPETYFLPACAKWNSNASWKNDPAYGEPGYYEIINGEIVLNKYGLFQIYAYGNVYNNDADDEHYKSMFFSFNGVKITLAKGATLKSITGTYDERSDMKSGNKKMLVDIKYDNCVFDISEAVNTVNCFNANDSKYTGLVSGESYYNTNSIVNITVGSVDIIAGNASVNLYSVNSKNGSWVKFVPGENGKYVTLSLKNGAAAPTFKGNDNALEFVKTSIGIDSTVYTFAPAALKSYSPKMSITLESQLVMNVYIPAENTQKFTFNGETYENLAALADKIVTVDGVDYYRMSVTLGSSEAASELKLVANVNVNGGVAVASFTFSIPKYAAKLIAGGTDVEKTLARDVLAYIKAAYEYFGTDHNTKEEIERVATLINSIIGDYTAAPVSSGVTNTASPVTSVTLNLDAKPTIRFYVTDTAVEFFANGKKLNTVTGTDATYGAYVELDVYAYALSETITYAGGSYHISSFVNGAKGTAHENLVNTFVKYVESAADYRNSVIGK